MKNLSYKLLLSSFAVLLLAQGAALASKRNHLTDEQIAELTLTEAKKALDCGRLTSERYLTVIFDRIERLSPKITDDPTKLNAFLFLNKKQALEQARCADKRRKEGHDVRTLEGLPISVKDVFDAEGEPTTGSTAGIKNSIPSTNAAVIDAFEHEGAIIIGKASTTEFGLLAHSANNTFAGTTRNPYNLPYTSGGSSSGASSATAARLGPVSLAEDFAGSIRWPASCCGVLGYRPTQDRWNNAGILFAENTNCLQNGPLCRSVEDAILLDSVVTNDWTKVKAKPSCLRIGVPREFFYDNVDPVIVAAIDATLVKLRKAGVTIIENNMGGVALLNQIPITLFILGNAQLGTPQQPGTVQATFDRWAADPNNPFLPTTVAAVEAQLASPDAINSIAFFNTLPTDPATIAFFTDIRNQIIALVNKYMDDNKLDALLLPVSPILTPLNPNPTDATNIGTALTSKSATVPVLKFPAINMPVGIDSNGLPIGADLIARSNDDRRLLFIAKAVRPQFATIPAPSL